MSKLPADRVVPLRPDPAWKDARMIELVDARVRITDLERSLKSVSGEWRMQHKLVEGTPEEDIAEAKKNDERCYQSFRDAINNGDHNPPLTSSTMCNQQWPFYTDMIYVEQFLKGAQLKVTELESLLWDYEVTHHDAMGFRNPL